MNKAKSNELMTEITRMQGEINMRDHRIKNNLELFIQFKEHIQNDMSS